MKLSKRLKTFRDEVIANYCGEMPAYMAYAEFTKEIEENNYYSVCDYASKIGVKIPRVLSDWKEKK